MRAVRIQCLLGCEWCGALHNVTAPPSSPPMCIPRCTPPWPFCMCAPQDTANVYAASYNETAVGVALERARASGIRRDEFYIQTKFTPGTVLSLTLNIPLFLSPRPTQSAMFSLCVRGRSLRPLFWGSHADGGIRWHGTARPNPRLHVFMSGIAKSSCPDGPWDPEQCMFDKAADLATQVKQSAQTSLAHLRVYVTPTCRPGSLLAARPTAPTLAARPFLSPDIGVLTCDRQIRAWGVGWGTRLGRLAAARSSTRLCYTRPGSRGKTCKRSGVPWKSSTLTARPPALA